jgi:hypothetical protein
VASAVQRSWSPGQFERSSDSRLRRMTLSVNDARGPSVHWRGPRWRRAGCMPDILRIHPFDDGNLRGALPALQAALVSLGSPMVHFEAAVAEHDEALGWALRADAESRTVEPFVELLLSRIRASGNPATE